MLGSAFIARGIAFGTTVLVARSLGPTDYGIYAVLLSTLTVTAIFSNLRLDVGLMRLIPQCLVRSGLSKKEVITSTWKFAMLVGFLSSVVFFMSASGIAIRIYGHADLTGYLRLVAIAIVFSIATQMGLATLSGLQDFRAVARVQIASALLQFGATLFGLHWMGLRGALWGYVFSIILTGSLFVAISKVRLQENRLWEPDRRLWSSGLREVIHFSGAYLLANLLPLSSLWCGNMIVARIRGFDEAAMFSVAYNIGIFTLFIPGYFLNPLLPFFSEVHASGQLNDFKNFLLRNFRLSVSVATPIAVFFCISSRQVLALLYGERFSQAWLAASFLSLAAVFGIGMAVFSMALASVDKVWVAFSLNVVCFAVFLSLSFAGASAWGATGVAFSFFASSAIGHIGYCSYASKAFELKNTGATKVTAVIFGSGILAVSLSALSLGIATWFIAGAAALVVWGAIWKVLYTPEEKTSARSLLGQFNGKLMAARPFAHR